MIECPKCGCTQVHSEKKGYDALSGVGGAILLGPLGLALGAADKDDVWLTCLDCGYKWKAGKPKQPQGCGCVLVFVLAGLITLLVTLIA